MIKKRMFYSFALIGCLFVSGCIGPSQGVLLKQYPLINVSSINGVKYLNLNELAKSYEMKLSVDNTTGIIFLDNAGQKIKILPGTKKILVDQKVRNLRAIIREKEDIIYMPMSFLSFLKAEEIVIPKKKIIKEKPIEKRIPMIQKIVIDPGHGGKDHGAKGYMGLKEKDIVLDISKRLQKALKRRGVKKATLTRKSDYFISLKRRTQIANKAKADLFISIHANAARSRRAKGFEVFYLSPAKDDTARAIAIAENEVVSLEGKGKPGYLNTTLWEMTLSENKEESKRLAQYISSKVPKAVGERNRGVKSANFLCT